MFQFFFKIGTNFLDNTLRHEAGLFEYLLMYYTEDNVMYDDGFVIKKLMVTESKGLRGELI